MRKRSRQYIKRRKSERSEWRAMNRAQAIANEVLRTEQIRARMSRAAAIGATMLNACNYALLVCADAFPEQPRLN